jgi:hypothetical protein
LPRLGEDLRALLALGIAALALAGCGGSSPAGKTDSTASAASGVERPAAERTAARRCRLGPFLHALDRLESRLAAGLTYEQYFEAVRGARAVYEAIPIERLELPCLTAVGTAGERALDQYIEAANVWRACRADLGCGTYAIEPRLQRKWRVASHYLAAAHEGAS